MKAQEYKRAIELYSDLRELPESEWARAVNSACAGNAELSAEVMRLLQADRHASSGRFLDRPAIEEAAQLLDYQFGCLPEPGTLVGRYRIRARIGAGGMGVVYEAHDERLERRVAVKVLPLLSPPGAEERIRRFEREARVISQLNHPNIISIFDADFDKGCYFIAMEFVEGQTLRSVIAGPKPNLDTRAVLDIVSQTASALAAAHEAGIVHRDIKPENIMLRPDGLVKVLDFGLAAIRDPVDAQPVSARPGDFETRPGHLAGTVQYLSPEQVAGKPATTRSDLFSLGVVAYELATGVRPFEGPTDGMIFNAILSLVPQPPSAVRPEIGTGLDALVMGMHEKDPELRYQTASDVRSACRRLLRDSGPAIPPGRDRAVNKPQPRRNGIFVVLSAFLVIAVTLGLYLNRPLPAPRVTRNVQITNGEPVLAFVNDGIRLYYSVGKPDSHAGFFEVGTHGGQVEEMPDLRGMLPLDISADRSQILLGAMNDSGGKESALWVGSVLGGAPRRLGGLYATYAHWSSRGDKIVFTTGGDVRVAAGDGSGAHVLFHVGGNGHASAPFFFDAGRRVRFTVAEKNSDKLWEIDADGKDPHPVLPNSEGGVQGESAMSADGKYSVFMAQQDPPSWDLWALREDAGFFRLRKSKPVPLTEGPLVATMPQFSPDGRRIFYIGNTGLDELVRYDPKLGWVPYLGGLDAVQLNFSKDGQWVTFVAPPGRSVWCSRIDGTQRRQLTTPPLGALNPRWSPDGTRIVFWGSVSGQPPGMFLVSSSGGTVTPLTARGTGARGELEASWSPDGRRVLYMVPGNSLEVIGIDSREVEKLPGSDGLRFPRWSPDGRYAAAEDTQSYLWLYDMATHQRTLLTTLGAGYPTWSRDSKYIYFENNACSVWYRVSVRERKVEELVSLAGLRLAANGFGWVGVAPHGSVISARDVSTQNIYAIDWDYQ